MIFLFLIALIIALPGYAWWRAFLQSIITLAIFLPDNA